MGQPLQIFPADAHNKVLIDNVHPADWINPEPVGAYNLVVIGAGNAGASLATIDSLADIVSLRVLGSFALLGLFALVPVLYNRYKMRPHTSA